MNTSIATPGVQLGDEVKDRISGFQGIATCRLEWLYGCIRFGVQPKMAKGEFKESQVFDEPQLIIVKRKAVPAPHAMLMASVVEEPVKPKRSYGNRNDKRLLKR